MQTSYDKQTKKCYCGTKDVCSFKQNFVNMRCFAPYAVRQTCRYVVRDDKKTWAEGSTVEGVWFK